ncbi:hypothetical protein ACFQY5_36930 [Paeniroseomonas aquatica]|uniref:hypothetical protein n=1 Tax=Paeniroseomonas aquatica TaxID=373043 RepID=UPI00361E096A
MAPARPRTQALPPVSRDPRDVLDDIMRDWPGRKDEAATPPLAPEPEPEIRNTWSGMPSDDELAELQAVGRRHRAPKPAGPAKPGGVRLPEWARPQKAAAKPANSYQSATDFVSLFQIEASGGDAVMLAWMREQDRLARIELEQSKSRARDQAERERVAAARAAAARASQERAPLSAAGEKLRQQLRGGQHVHMSATVQRTTVTSTSFTVEEVTVTTAVWRQTAESRRGLVSRALDWIADGAATVAQDMQNHAEYSKRVAAEDADEESRFGI